MPIPKNLSLPMRVKAWLTWADIDQACGVKPLGWRRFARMLLKESAVGDATKLPQNHDPS